MDIVHSYSPTISSSDSEDEDLYPADQPDLPYTTPGAPRIKFAVDA